jgi:hypothetical protein
MSADLNRKLEILDELQSGITLALQGRTLPDDLRVELENLRHYLHQSRPDALPNGLTVADLHEILGPLFGTGSVEFYAGMAEGALGFRALTETRFVDHMAEYLREEVMALPDPSTALNRLRMFAKTMRFAKAEHQFHPTEERRRSSKARRVQVEEQWPIVEEELRASRRGKPRLGEIVGTIAGRLGVSDRTVRRHKAGRRKEWWPNRELGNIQRGNAGNFVGDV